MRPIAVIDDDADMRDVITFALENDGHKVLTYQNGKEALDNLLSLPESRLPFIIILDYLMPEMDGVRFIEELHLLKSSRLRDIPVIFASAMDDMHPLLQENANIIHLPKPMELEELLKLVRKFAR